MKTAETPKAPSPQSTASDVLGQNIAVAAERLRNIAAVERARLKILAGWFLRIGDFETKYKLAYHLYDASEHITWIRTRLQEMRGGNTNASVRPDLVNLLENALHAPSDTDFLAGFYGVLTSDLAESIRVDLKKMDTSANANEIRILQRTLSDLDVQLDWYHSLNIDLNASAWALQIQALSRSIGGIHGETKQGPTPPPITGERFERPTTILFDDSIQTGQLESYANRQQMDPQQATIEQFKVFFNEFYAAALLAGILFDAPEGLYPWEFFADFSRHFWDETRHSEFGANRLRELGVNPSKVNPVLFEESQGLPILHRVTYLTRGLEAYFMPRKPKRMKEYQNNGDMRSQIFADHDWSDEINHVRYGSRWTNHLLENDHREIDDVIEEVKSHLSKIRNTEVTTIEAPF
ncbi:DUF455 family protein [Pelagicoccus sp. SDUM812005]|uniref:DUF455 family protein n=1 Tax=Pelagicoccus sp. SDUM812005 TaxID=3041257 RepID=UPI00280D5DAA|nr:DUF455 family protein [Pelagicoccus sp. SDUM812005]MDQ8179121.1 DUF455 family protein [Pelagicoccus sp. SDUM812005]